MDGAIVKTVLHCRVHQAVLIQPAEALELRCHDAGRKVITPALVNNLNLSAGKGREEQRVKFVKVCHGWKDSRWQNPLSMKRVLISLRRMPPWFWALPAAAALGAVPAVVSLFDHRAETRPTQRPAPSLGPYGAAYVPAGRFQWPLDPPDRPHPVRATFGEPRGLLGPGIPREATDRAELIRSGGPLNTPGRRVIHSGIDIAAPDGTPVFAVKSGIAATGGEGYETHVIVADFGYWHLAEAVPDGTEVTAFVTVIGRIYPGQGHVHLARFAGCHGACTERDRVLNPLVNGGISPYVDTAPPRIGGIRAYNRRGQPLRREALSGPVALVLNVVDPQSFGSHDTGIYRLSYRILPAGKSGAVVGPVRVLRLDAIPGGRVRNSLYTSGSTRHSTKTNFSYILTARSPTNDGLLHTERLRPGDYTLEVTAGDVRGNHSVRSFGVRIIDPRLEASRAPRPTGPRL